MTKRELWGVLREARMSAKVTLSFGLYAEVKAEQERLGQPSEWPFAIMISEDKTEIELFTVYS